MVVLVNGTVWLDYFFEPFVSFAFLDFPFLVIILSPGIHPESEWHVCGEYERFPQIVKSVVVER